VYVIASVYLHNSFARVSSCYKLEE
jgi:hypothetical protein